MSDPYEDIHSCSYKCSRPACIERQRDELFGFAKAMYDAYTQANPKHRLTFAEVMQEVTDLVTKETQ